MINNNKVRVCVRDLPACDWLSSAGCPCLQRSSWRLQMIFFFSPPPPQIKKSQKKKRREETESKRREENYEWAGGFRSYRRGWLLRNRSCIGEVTHLYGQMQEMEQPSGPVHWSTTSCCRPQSHLLQTQPSAPVRGCPPSHEAARTPRSNPHRCSVSSGWRRDGASGVRGFVRDPKPKAHDAFDEQKRDATPSLPFMLSSSAHTKHSSPPPPPTTHTHTHTHTLFLFLPFPPSNTLHVRESGCNEI